MFVLEDERSLTTDAGNAASDAKLLEEVEAEGRRVEAQRVRFVALVGELIESEAYRYDGITSVTAFLVHRIGISAGTARRIVELAHRLREMPILRTAGLEGLVSVNKLQILARAQAKHPDAFGEFEELFCRQAQTLTVAELRKAVAYWLQALDQAEPVDGYDEPSKLYLAKTFGNRFDIAGSFTPVDGEIVATALDAIVSDQIRKNPSDDTDRRGVAEMRADALVEICRHYLDNPDRPTVGGERPHLTVRVDLPTLLGTTFTLSETTSGAIVPRDLLEQIACDAAVRRVVFDPHGHPLDVGRSTRTVPPAIRTAVVERDQHCIWPTCHRPPSWCDCHHVISWLDHGETAVDNLVLLCRTHHAAIHQHGYILTHDGHGGLTLTRPDHTTLHHYPNHLTTPNRAPP